MSAILHPVAITLIGYAAWMIVLILWLGYVRISLLLSGKRTSVKFSPTGEDVSPFCARLCRVHANCFENFPILIAIVAAAFLTGKIDQVAAFTDVFLFSRIAQSAVHLWSVRPLAVRLRFFFYVVQLGLQIYWIVKIII